MSMSIRSWLRHLAHATGRIRSCFLHALFRRPVGPRRLTTLAPRGDQATPLAASVPLDEHRLRLLATGPLCVTSSYEERLAQLGSSSHPTAPLPDARLCFPLAEYRAAVRGGLASAEEWVHYCRVDRRLAFDLLFPASASPHTPRPAEDDDVLVIHGTRGESPAPRSLADGL